MNQFVPERTRIVVRLRLHVLLWLAISFLSLSSSSLAAENPETFWIKKIDPLLDRYCLKCHAGVRQKSDLDLRSLHTVLRGGHEGPAFLPGRPEESRIYQYVQMGADPHMPPEGKKQLKPEEIALLRTAIAKFPKLKSIPATGAATNNTWITNYIAELRELQNPPPVPPLTADPVEVIDSFLELKWKRDKVFPSKPASESVLVRRLYLDLIGRIPTDTELEIFLADRKPKARERLVDQLLQSEDYPRHMRNIFDVILMGRAKKNNESARRDNGWHTFLEHTFKANRPWNETVRAIILARGTNDIDRGASWYLYERRNNFQAMAEAISPVLFGSQIACAQCHNHPLAWEIEQRHYWGLVAAFNRSKGVQMGSGVTMSESATGGFIKFANLKKESQPALLAFLNGKEISENPGDENLKDDPSLYLVPPSEKSAIPKFSRRQALADATTSDNPMLARSFVNRIWANLLGRGLVHPVDQMDSRHPSSHSELLDWLSRYFEKSGYDVRNLVRQIVLSRAYQLDSRAGRSRNLLPEHFAKGLEKPLTAEQLFHSVLIATGTWDGKGLPEQPSELKKELVKRFPDVFPAHYNPSLEQALFLSNSSSFNELLKPKASNTADRLMKLPDLESRIEEAFRLILGRDPSREERKQFTSLLRSKIPDTAVRDLLWSLLASAEFQMNH